MNAVMLRALPVQDPPRLVLFGQGRAVGVIGGLPDGSTQLFSYPFYREVQWKNEVFSGVAAMESLPNSVSAMVNRASDAERVEVRLVSGTYFSVLGVNPVLGRTFTDADDQTPGGHPVAVASYSWWRRRFGGDPSVAGRTLTIGSVVYTIIGIAPPEFFGTAVGESPDLWIPLAMIAQVPPGWSGDKGLQDKLFQSVYIMARLRPGVSAERAGAHLNNSRNTAAIRRSSESPRTPNTKTFKRNRRRQCIIPTRNISVIWAISRSVFPAIFAASCPKSGAPSAK